MPSWSARLGAALPNQDRVGTRGAAPGVLAKVVRSRVAAGSRSRQSATPAKAWRASGAFSAQRTVSTYAISADDLSASAELAQALQAHHVVLDDFRLVPSGSITTKLAELRALRRDLAAKKIEAARRQLEAAARRADASGRIADLNTVLDDLLKENKDIAATKAELAEARQLSTAALSDEDRASIAVSNADAVLTTVDQFVAALRTVPAGQTRSPLAMAAMREQLRGGGDGRFSHVLLVKSQGGAANQVVDDRPFWYQDKFSVIASVSVAFVMICDREQRGARVGGRRGHGLRPRPHRRLVAGRGPVLTTRDGHRLAEFRASTARVPG